MSFSSEKKEVTLELSPSIGTYLTHVK